MFTGEPNHDPSHPDYTPSIFPAAYKITTSSTDLSRCARRQEREGLYKKQQAREEEQKLKRATLRKN